MVADRAPYDVVCRGLDPTPGRFATLRAARSYAQGVASREDVECAITDRFGVSTLVRRASFAPDREYDPYRRQPFFHPNPEHPRSRKRFLRNEPQAWTPGVGPSQTQIKPREFFGMDDGDDTMNLLGAVAPPLLLMGAVLFLMRPRGDLGDDGAPRGAVRRHVVRVQKGRHAARKLYGSAVLTAQAAGSMRKLALDMQSRSIAQEAVSLQRTSRRLLDRAMRLDPGFVQKKIS